MADRELGMFWVKPSEHLLEATYLVIVFPLEKNMRAGWVDGCEELLGQTASDVL